MLHAVHKASALAATAFAERYHLNPPPDINPEKPEWVWRSTPEDPARNSQPGCDETRTASAHANRIATLGRLSASIANQINQPITAAVIGDFVLLMRHPTLPNRPCNNRGRRVSRLKGKCSQQIIAVLGSTTRFGLLARPLLCTGFTTPTLLCE
jgi:hypothetical protein